MSEFKDMEEAEAALAASNDIYRVSARVKNHARSTSAALTPVGEALCNTFTLVLMDLYSIAETLPEPYKNTLTEYARSKERIAGDFIINMTPKKRT